MAVKKMIVTGTSARPPSNESPKQASTKGSSTEDGHIVAKLSVGKSKPKTRLKKSSAVRRPGNGVDVIPGQWIASNHGEDYESMENFQLCGQKQGLHLPNIRDKKGRAAKSILRIQHIQQSNVTDKGSVIFPALVATGEPREFNPLRPPTKSPRDYYLSLSPPCDHCCDPSKEYYDLAPESCDHSSLDYRDAVRSFSMMPHPPSHSRPHPHPQTIPRPPSHRKPPTHLPSINPRMPGGRRF